VHGLASLQAQNKNRKDSFGRVLYAQYSSIMRWVCLLLKALA